ncbi:MAG: hypothetical protein ACMG6E_09785 [Candidatus Roizmanbacteria bacterium]
MTVDMGVLLESYLLEGERWITNAALDTAGERVEHHQKSGKYVSVRALDIAFMMDGTRYDSGVAIVGVPKNPNPDKITLDLSKDKIRDEN